MDTVAVVLIEILFDHEPAAPVNQDSVNVFVCAVDDTIHETRCDGAIQSGLRDLTDFEAVAEVSGPPVFVGQSAAIRADWTRLGTNSGRNRGINSRGKPGEEHASRSCVARCISNQRIARWM